MGADDGRDDSAHAMPGGHILASRVSPEPTSNYDAYRAAIRVALRQNAAEWTFKSDTGYREVLEHVTPNQGARLLEWALSAEPRLRHVSLAKLATRNDSLGQPVTAEYPGYGEFSPSNWRYLAHAVHLWHHIESLGLRQVDVVELGGGYGGLALWGRGIAHLYRTLIRRYTVVDLFEASALQRRYAAMLGVDADTVDGSDPVALQGVVDPSMPTVLMSAYAFSEFAQDIRDWYSDRLIRHCQHGLIVWNFPEAVMGADGREYGGPVYPFTDKPFTVEPDQPELYSGHQIVRW